MSNVDCDREHDVAAEARDHLQSWLARFLWHWADSGVLESDAAKAIVTRLETCLPISERTLSSPLEDPSELVRTLENDQE